MANTTLTPSMRLVLPIPGTETGPAWANEINASLYIVDNHTHGPGSGERITPSGLNLNADVSFNNASNAVSLRSVRFTSQMAPIALPADIGCIYEAGDDLYYNDAAGNQVRITESGAVAGSSGTITGLPSGTASAAFTPVNGTFVFQQSTSTAANLDVGSIAIRYPGSYPTPTGNYIQLQAPVSLASGYSLTLPALPAANNTFLTISTAGVIAATAVLDNVTVESPGNVLQVKNASITLAKRTAPNLVLSGTPGSTYITTSATYADITNVTLSITTTGRPVMIFGYAAGAGTASLGAGNNSTNTQAFSSVRLLRGVTIIGIYESSCFFGGISQSYNIPVGAIRFFDTPAAGTYTYKLQLAADGISGNFASWNTGGYIAAYEL